MSQTTEADTDAVDAYLEPTPSQTFTELELPVEPVRSSPPTPPPSYRRSLHRQSSVLFKRLTERVQSAPPLLAPATATTPEKKRTRATGTAAEKSKGRAAPAPPLPLPPLPSTSTSATGTVSDALGCGKTADNVASRIIPILRSDIILMGKTLDGLSVTVSNLTDSVQTLADATTEQVSRNDALPALVSAHTEALEELRAVITANSAGDEQHERETGIEFDHLHQRLDILSDSIQSVSQSVATVAATVTQMSREVQSLQAAQPARAPAPAPQPSLPAPTILPQLPAPAAAAPPAPVLPGVAPQPAPGFPHGGAYPNQRRPTNTAPRYNSYRGKRVRTAQPSTAGLPPPLPPPAVVNPVPHHALPPPPPQTVAQLPPLPAPSPEDHPTIVRFGRMDFAYDAALRKQQLYAAARPAFDAYPVLFPSISDVALAVDDSHCVEITFPSHELALRFVDLWVANRHSAGVWKAMQAHLLHAPSCAENHTILVPVTLRVISWNIYGSFAVKASAPWFHNFVRQWDIVCVQETHLCPDQEDLLDLPPGYSCLARSRPQSDFMTNQRGGVLMIFRAELPIKDVTPSATSDLLAVEIGTVTLLNVYLPPSNTAWTRALRVPPEQQLVEYLLPLSLRGDFQAVLVGDFNARTASRSHSLPRSSPDQGPPSTRGLRLLEMCVDLDLEILNGTRLQDASTLTRYTSFQPGGDTVIDLALATGTLVAGDVVRDLVVHERWAQWSDHAPISLTLIRQLRL
ncbi:DNase I-like protein [Lentinus brumalis]|uniref:DNase I-like protein n=1 Tax=Lentinus brumalis TaxID=2498619 RepID=A0A371CXJ7_9APHY|nr:DNase I-like protein [Polyporus brumalis]